ncbi:hypothetical protein BV25DRAFT_1842288 [Artomyces pyxidatus]|uniref:Uncharacterized protein n=1 Tax=Artomyces pyxidatus TaxID=48021 RepID=A0ACB8SJI7_9AGAM|nr:hypothetical protein BV25DRAFT_1842288 [Artomyces pyxidatus]
MSNSEISVYLRGLNNGLLLGSLFPFLIPAPRASNDNYLTRDMQDMMSKVDEFLLANPDITYETVCRLREGLQIPLPQPGAAPFTDDNVPIVEAYGAVPTMPQTSWGYSTNPQLSMPVQAHGRPENERFSPSDYLSLPSPTWNRRTPSTHHSWASSAGDTPPPSTPTDAQMPTNADIEHSTIAPFDCSRPASAATFDGVDYEMEDIHGIATPLLGGDEWNREAEREGYEDGGETARLKRPGLEVEKRSQGPSSQATSEVLDKNTMEVQNGDNSEAPAAVDTVQEVSTVSQLGPSALRKTGPTSRTKTIRKEKAEGGGRGAGKAAALGRKVIKPKPTCSVCGESFNRIYDVQRHQAVHARGEAIKCDRCGALIRSRRKDILLRHQRTATCSVKSLEKKEAEVLASGDQREGC